VWQSNFPSAPAALRPKSIGAADDSVKPCLFSACKRLQSAKCVIAMQKKRALSIVYAEIYDVCRKNVQVG